MLTERWKPIPNYSSYAVSNLGHVRRILPWKIPNGGVRQPRPLIPQMHGRGTLQGQGYLSVRLYKGDGTWKQWLVHRLVLIAFRRSPHPGEEANHKDGCKVNNILNNLEWGTQSHNRLHALRLGLISLPRGRSHYLAKPLSAMLFQEILHAPIEKRGDLTALANRVGLNRVLIQRIRSGKHWMHNELHTLPQ